MIQISGNDHGVRVVWISPGDFAFYIHLIAIILPYKNEKNKQTYKLELIALIIIACTLNFLYIIRVIRVLMKRKLSLDSLSYKIYPFKHAISKFEITGVKIADFVSAQSWAILPSKLVFELRSQ